MLKEQVSDSLAMGLIQQTTRAQFRIIFYKAGLFHHNSHLLFSGDLTCQDIRCDYNADCVQRFRNSPQCYCKQGFEGNGTYCSPIDERRPPEYPTHNQQPTPQPTPHYEEVIPRCILGVCYCPDGYDIDDTVSRCLKKGEYPDGSQNGDGGRRESK